jgi:glucans biosynthesis protein
MRLSRRAFLGATTALALTGPLRAAGIAEPFAPAQVTAMARALAARPYRARDMVPEDWRALTYEQYRSLWFRPTEALWQASASPYAVDFFAPGLYFPRPVKMFEVVGGKAEPVPFDLGKFDRTDRFPEMTIDETLGYSGLRLRTELTEPGKKNEFCVFQGASYFRAIAHDMIYGLSARGLALKTGDPMGEEFPDFIRFWLERPEPGQKNIVIHALMDSPSVAGAYRFDITPGPDCVMEVEAEIFARETLDHVGLGALTSMFLFDETVPTRFDDFRPAVHDSDGLLVWNGAGEMLWRPLANPRKLQVSGFADDAPRGFGLMQRARNFSDFNDLEALYHRRPGLWVEPKGDWGPGAVTLVEIPADQEIYDNIVAYWRPRDPIAAGESRKLAYRLTWGARAPVDAGVAQVIATAMGKRHAWAEHPDGRMVTVDFGPHPAFANGPEVIEIHVSSPHLETTPGILQRNPATGGLRLAFSFDPKDRDLVELRAQLRRDGAPVSEVWLYRWTA